MLILIPTLVYRARGKYKETLEMYHEKNFHRTTLSSNFWVFFIWGLSVVVFVLQVSSMLPKDSNKGDKFAIDH